MRPGVKGVVDTARMHLRPALRDLAAEVLWRTGRTAPKRTNTRKLTIVTFHRVLTPAQLADYPIPGIAVTTDEFDWFLDFFAQHFDCGTLLGRLDAFRDDPLSCRPRLAITFDDGQLDNFENARPILARHNITATFFATVLGTETGAALWHDEVAFAMSALLRRKPEVAARHLDELGLGDADPTDAPRLSAERLKALGTERRRAFIANLQAAAGTDGRPSWDGMMNADHLRRLVKEGHEIGSHTDTHAILVHCDAQELTREVSGSRARLESACGAPVESFCYPNGDCNEQVTAEVKAAGYRAAVTTAWGLNDARTDLVHLRRCDIAGPTARSMRGHLSPARLGLRLSGMQPGL